MLEYFDSVPSLLEITRVGTTFAFCDINLWSPSYHIHRIFSYHLFPNESKRIIAVLARYIILTFFLTLFFFFFRKDISPIVENCNCYTCQNHTKAYINHLLNVHEMLAQILLEMYVLLYLIPIIILSISIIDFVFVIIILSFDFADIILTTILVSSAQ